MGRLLTTTFLKNYSAPWGARRASKTVYGLKLGYKRNVQSPEDTGRIPHFLFVIIAWAILNTDYEDEGLERSGVLISGYLFENMVGESVWPQPS
jgi:hypothetical protein